MNMISSHYFEYHKQKTIQALRYHFIGRTEIKIMMILVNVFAVLSAGLFYWKKIAPSAFLLSSMLWFLMMLLFWFFLPRMIYKKSASFKDSFKVTMNEYQFILQHTKAEKSWDWSSFSSWMESPYFFHLYFSSTSFFLIPKDGFEEDDIVKARNYFRSHIQKK